MTDVDSAQKTNLLATIAWHGHEMYTPKRLATLPSLPYKVARSTKDKCYLYYQNNTCVEVSKDGITTGKISDLPYPVLEPQVVKRDYVPAELDPGFDFYKFMQNICSDKVNESWVVNQQKMDCLLSAIGYLIHNYKSPEEAKIIVLIDDKDVEINREVANGGTGKSIIMRALSNIASTLIISGKQFDSDSQFKYQLVTFIIRILAIDDVGSKFKIEEEYDTITNGMHVEKKGETPSYIPFEESPKEVCTSNKNVGDAGDSSTRRIHEVPFSHYYNKLHQPKHDFGKVFFNEWDENAWHQFDAVMIAAIQCYLTKGLVTVETDQRARIMAERTNPVFADFCKQLGQNVRLYKNELRERFRELLSATEGAYLMPSTIGFKRWLDIYAEVYQLFRHHGSSNGKTYVQFWSIKNTTPIEEQLGLDYDNSSDYESEKDAA